MVTLPALWLPILLSAVAVFVASSLIHMVLKYHNTDLRGLPDEEAARRALGALKLAPGDYVVPYCGSAKEMSNPEYLAKRTEGPVAIFTVMKSGTGSMGPALGQWFGFLVVVGVFVAYVARLSLPAVRNTCWCTVWPGPRRSWPTGSARCRCRSGTRRTGAPR